MQLWRKIQRDNFTEWKRLCTFLELETVHHDKILSDTHFPLNLPARLAKKIAKNCWTDPLLRQFLPTRQEKIVHPLFTKDPVKDAQFRTAPKLLHKYTGRALLVCTSACAMNCRFCFRQNFDYEKEDKSFEAELEAIRQDTTLTEIILSGGDPLSLSNELLHSLIDRLSAIPHLKRLRFHTRFPIGIPERIDEGFIDMIRSTRLQVFFVVHCNHPQELDEDIFAALKKLQLLGCPVLSQTVLLKDVNDNLKILCTLFETLVDRGILPYYIHQLDRVQGTAHFEVPLEDGRKLAAALRAHLPGYAVPDFVAEIPDQPSKTPL